MALMDHCNGACPLTGITDPELLHASDIVPWADCVSHAQRLDFSNGLLLSSLWNTALDSGLTSFSGAGQAIALPRLPDAAAKKLGLTTAMPLMLTPEHRVHMVRHSGNIWLTD